MIENYKLNALRDKSLAQVMEAPAGLSLKDFIVMRQEACATRRILREETND